MASIVDISKKIKRARVLSGLSQKQMAKKLGLSDKTISAYELGRAIPPATTLQKIAQITKQSMYVFFEDNPKNNLEIISKKLDIILKELKKLSK